LWSATLGNRELAIGSAAIEGTPLGNRRYGGEERTTANGPVPAWCKGLIDAWIHDIGVTEGKVFRRVSKNGIRQDEGVITDVVWYAVKRYAKRIGIDHLAPHDLRRYAVYRIMPNHSI
jgi:integrase